MVKAFVAAALVSATLAACGGGGGGDNAPQAPATSDVAGLWNGTTSNGRTVAALTLQDGTIWALYSATGNANVVAGVVQANGTVSGQTITGVGADYSLQTGTITPGSITATVVANTSISGTAGAVTFTGQYDTSFDQPPSLATIAGTYTGSGTASGGAESATVTVSTAGAISGTSASGCAYTGTASPRADGNAYNVSVTFAGGVCANGTDTVTGIAYYRSTGKVLYSAALNGAKTNGFLFIGTKP